MKYFLLLFKIMYHFSGKIFITLTLFTFCLPDPGFSQSPVQLTAVNKAQGNGSWPASSETSEYVFKNEICDLTYDSISGKVLVGLVTKDRIPMIDPWWKRYEQLPDPEEYKRWFPEPWMMKYPDI